MSVPGTLRNDVKRFLGDVDAFKKQRSQLKISRSIAQPFIFIIVGTLYWRFVWDSFFWFSAPIIAFFFFLLAQRYFQTLVHDSAHSFFSLNTVKNDFLANYLCAGWIGSTVEKYRSVHLKHHQHNGSGDDPEFISFKIIAENGGVFQHVSRYILCGHLVRLFKKYYLRPRKTANEKNNSENRFINFAHVFLCQFLLLVFFYLSTHSLFPYLLWVYIAISWSPLLSGLRFLVEHPGETDLTRTTYALVFERVFFAPLNFNYHFEHHKWPSIPPYRLKEVHRVLVKKDFFSKNPEILTRGFLKNLYKGYKA